MGRIPQNEVCASIGLAILCLLSGTVTGEWLLECQNYAHKTIGFDTSAQYYPVSIMERGRRFIPRQPGLTGESNTVSFESADFPGKYLRHYGYELFAEYPTERNPNEFNNDATYTIYPNRYYRGYYAFESVNYGSYFIRHKDSTVRITNSSDNAQWFEADASFRFVRDGVMLQPRRRAVCPNPHCKVAGGPGSQAIVSDDGLYFNMVSPGPGGQPNSVGFELQNSPGYYLRDYGQYGFLDAANTSRSSSTYLQDTNFMLRFNRFSSGHYAIESVKYPGRFLRANGFYVKFESQDGTNNFAGDASFRIVNGPVYLESKNMPDYKMGLDGTGRAQMTTKGYRFNLFYPGLTGDDGTVSFESYEQSGFYLRHYNYDIYLEDVSNNRNPAIFNQDSTFFLRKDVWHNDYIVFESINYRNHSIKHFDYNLLIAQYDASEIFKEDSCYKMIEAPPGFDDSEVLDPSTSSNTGAIVGGVIGLLVAIILIVALVIYTNRKFAWVDTIKLKVQRQGGSGDEGGLENPSYPVAGYSVEQDNAQVTQRSSASSVSSMPTTPTGDPPDDQSKPNPVRRLSRQLSNSMSRLRRSLSGESKEEERHIDVPQAFGLSVQDFQPGTETSDPTYEEYGAQDSKGNFGNPMYGLKQLAPEDVDEQTQQVPKLQRHDSLLENSPTLFGEQPDFSKAMSFFDETLEMAEVTESAKEKEQAGGVGDLYSKVDMSTKKKLSPGITAIAEDDLWGIGDA